MIPFRLHLPLDVHVSVDTVVNESFQRQQVLLPQAHEPRHVVHGEVPDDRQSLTHHGGKHRTVANNTEEFLLGSTMVHSQGILSNVKHPSSRAALSDTEVGCVQHKIETPEASFLQL